MSFKLHGTVEAFRLFRSLMESAGKAWDPDLGRMVFTGLRCDRMEAALREAEGEYARLLGHCGHQREELSKLSERIADGEPDDRWIDLPIGTDGEPIRLGDTVRCGDGEPFEVAEIMFRRYCEAYVGDGTGNGCFDASFCSHAAPDSWEAIEAEARERLDDGLHPNDGWVLDLLYRVRGLYEGKGE